MTKEIPQFDPVSPPAQLLNKESIFGVSLDFLGCSWALGTQVAVLRFVGDLTASLRQREFETHRLYSSHDSAHEFSERT